MDKATTEPWNKFFSREHVDARAFDSAALSSDRPDSLDGKEGSDDS
jgi:hypothetical protein